MEKARFIQFGRGLMDHVRADFSGRERDKLYVSRAGKAFAEVSYLSGADSVEDGRAFAKADFDRDGYEDIVLMNRNAPMLKLFRNQVGPASGASFIGVELVGRGPARGQRSTTRDAVGAKVIARCGGRTFTSESSIGAGMGVQNSRVLTMGLDRCETLESLEVRFPSGAVVKASALPARRRYVATEGGAITEVPGIYGARAPAAAAEAKVTAPPAGPALLAALGASTGELVVVELWASWCEPCKRLRPRLDRLGARFGDRVRIVGVSVEEKDDAATVQQYVAANAPGHELRPFSKAAIDAAKELLGGTIAATPSTIVLDANTGRVELATAGVPSESDLERLFWRRAR